MLSRMKGVTLRVVTVPPEEETAGDPEWLLLSAQGLAAAYGETEPDYPLDLIREPNPDYEGR